LVVGAAQLSVAEPVATATTLIANGPSVALACPSLTLTEMLA
jgi:hypothetical protein